MKRWSGICVFVATIMMVAGFAYAGPLADATSDTLWGIEVGGYLDASYSYNINDPVGTQGAIGLRPWSADHDEFQLNGLQLYIDRLPEDEGEAGFRIDVLAGEDAPGVGDLLGMGNDDFSIYQGFLSYIAPVGNGLTIDVGRFATWYGYEVIESPANDNFSRGLLYTIAQPFTHTGIRMTYPINDMWEVSGGVTNGWNTGVNDNNDGVTVHGAVRWMPMETVYIQPSISYGPEQAMNNDQNRLLVNVVASWEVAEGWTVGGDFDYEQDEDAIGGTSDAELWGFAGYARYDVNEDLYLAVRGEWIDDSDGFYTPGIVAPDNELWEVTVTAGYQVTEGLLARLEYRHDDSDAAVFPDDSAAGVDDQQDVISIEVIYSF